MSPVEFTADVPIPPRSRKFTVDDAQAVLHLLNGAPKLDDNGNPVLGEDGQPEHYPPVRNVGFGEFASAGAARSAGVTLNRLLTETLGAPHRYKVTTIERDGKTVGVLVNQPAKQRAAETTDETTGETTDETPARRRRRSS